MDKRPFIFFPIITLLVGQLAGGISFVLFPFDPATSGYVSPPVFPSPVLFTLVWTVLYISMGISIAYIWVERKRVNIDGVLATFILLMFATLIFVPAMNISKGSPGVMTVLDINGTLAAFTYGLLSRNYSRKAFRWAIPLMVWMPLTTLLKIWMWSLN